MELPGGPRSALIIGNSEYPGFEFTSVLKSLDVIEAALEKEGFEVIRLENPYYKDLPKRIEEYAKTVPTNGTALVYYSGIAVTYKRLGKVYNALRPAKEDTIAGRGLYLSKVLESLDRYAGSRNNLLFIDGAWDSPIEERSKEVKLGLMAFAPDFPDKTTIVFNAPAETALPLPDSGVASEFSRKLAANLKKLKTSIEVACKSLGNVWYTTPENAGIGQISQQPLMTLRQGKTAGEYWVNATGMSFRWCPPGTFTMGTNDSGNPYTRDREPVDVTLSKGFWIGQYEVTQREYAVVMRKNPPRGFTVGLNIPWWGVGDAKQIRDFCKKLSDLEKKAKTLPDGWKYDILTEAQWEYACRSGSNSSFCFGDDITKLGQYANFADKALHSSNPDYYWAEKRTNDGIAEALAPVGSYLPNAWGIHDMHGNVAELIADHYQPKYPGGTDPYVQLKKDGKPQIRGGAWCSLPLYCQSTFRNSYDSRKKANYVGFRIAIVHESK